MSWTSIFELLSPNAWLVLLGILQIADWYTTKTILKNGGIELNPIVNKLMKVLGVERALIAKGFIAMGCGYFLLSHPIWLAILTLLYVVVILWNSYHLFKQHQLKN